ncbi:MAG: type II toxin-antitoxin system Phd/YefM family antitoxin [Gaiellaceae bacterium]
MAQIVPFSEARARLTDLVDQVEYKHEHVVITRNGRPAVVLVSTEEYEAIQETLEILQDDETMAALRRSDEDVAAGRLHSWDEVKRELGLA